MSGALYSESLDDFIYFDGVLEEQWDEPVSVTTHPVDNRSPVSDHIQALQRKLFLRAVITGSPSLTATIFYPPVGKARYLGIRDLLREHRSTPFRYISPRTGVIERLVLKGLRYSIDPRERVIFSLDFVQIAFAQTQTGKLPPRPKKKRDEIPVPSGAAGLTKVPTGAPLFESRTRALKDLFASALPSRG